MLIFGEQTQAKDCYSVITVADVPSTGGQDLMFTADYPQIITLDRIHAMARNKGGAVGAIAWAFVVVREGEVAQTVDPGTAGDFYSPCSDVIYEGILPFDNNVGHVEHWNRELIRRPLLKLQKGDSIFISYDRTGTDVWLRTITYWSIWA